MDEKIKVKITEVLGDDPRYDAWSVSADVWVEKNDEKKFERTVNMNVLKEDRQFDPGDTGNPRIVERIKEKYEKELLDHPEYKELVSQERQDEAEKAKSLEDEEFEV